MFQSHALALLKTGANVFLTGEPGSGKTHTVNAYISYLKKKGIEPAVTASTGIAATHIGGRTIHSWSGVGISVSLEKKDIQKIARKPHVARRIRNTHVLIIDEVSMLSPDLFSMVEAVCRAAREDQRPFGGMQVVVVGDFFQLPPIRKQTQSQTQQSSMLGAGTARFAYESPAWERADFKICYLTEQHRQDDQDLLEILSAIRRNAFTEEHLRHIERRKITDGYAPDDVPKLFSHNANVDKVNEEKLRRIPGEEKRFYMSTKGSKKEVSVLQKGCLSPDTLTLKEGAVVMCTKNNAREGFVNGTLGTVEGFAADNGYPIIRTRDDEEIYMDPMEWSLEEGGEVRASIRQIPLRLAWAMTVHKSQGVSLDEAVMDLSRVFEYGQGYVAISRIRRLSGLHIFGWNQRAFQVDEDVYRQDGEFRASSQELEEMLVDLTPEEQNELENAFIVRCGGIRTK